MRLYSDKNIVDNNFKNKLSAYGVKPSGRVWWRITNHLDSKQKKSGGTKWIAGISVLLLVCSSVAINNFFYSHSNIPPSGFIGTKEYEAVNEKKIICDSAAEVNFNSKNLSIAKHDEKEIDKNSGAGYIVSSIKKDTRENPSEVDLSKKFNNNIPFMKTSNEMMLKYSNEGKLNKQSEYELKGKRYSANSFKGYLGGSVLLNSTWLIDKTAMSSENLKYAFTTGIAFGMEGGYNISKHFGIGGGWYVNSSQGQNYKNIDQYERTTSLEYQDKNISFTYMNIPVFAKYRISKYSIILDAPVNVNIILGGQYGKMISYKNNEVKGELSSNDLFYKNDFAVVTGIDYDLFSNHPVFYTFGIRASYGSNVFNSKVPNDYEFNKPHNMLLGIHLALNFSMDKNGFTKR